MSAQVLWPARESLYQLMLLRATIGPAAFSSEKQDEPIDPTLAEWGPEYFDYPGFWFDKWPDKPLLKVLALDPSKGKDAKHGDYSAYVRYGWCPATGEEYIEADLRRDRTAEIIVDDGIEHVRQFGPEAFAIETNTFAELFCVLFEQASKRHQVSLPTVPVENLLNKQVRIRRHGSYLWQRKPRFKNGSAGTSLLVDQLKVFPLGEHDDGPDAWEMARRVAIQIWNGRQEAKKRAGRVRV